AALPVVHRRFGMRYHPRQREAEPGAGLQGLLDKDEHGVLVEASGREIGVLRQRDFELAAFYRLFDVDAGVAQPIEVIVPVLRGQDMKGALAAVDAVANERQQRIVFLNRRTEERTDMPVLTQHGSSKWNGYGSGIHLCLRIRSSCVFKIRGRGPLSLLQAV